MSKDDFIGIDPADLAKLYGKLDGLPDAVLDSVVDEIAPYLVNLMRQYPPPKKVTRKQAYGVTFFTAKQRRWFFAALADGRLKIPYKRTQTLAKNWKVIGEGRNTLAVNETPYAQFVQGNDTQSRMQKKIGWNTMEQVTEKHKEGIIKKIMVGIKKGLKLARLGG